MTTLLVAATGGHLAQLHQLRPRLVQAETPVVWATFDSPQSRSMLSDEVVEYVPYTAPRDYRTVVSNIPHAVRILRRHKVDTVISTGSGIALSFLPAARLMGKRALYIESAARSDGPSTTGRILRFVPGTQLAAQYASWSRPPWARTVSVFDDFLSTRQDTVSPVRSLVVTLGTIEGYGFNELVDRVRQIAPGGVDIMWQTGATDVTDLPIEARPLLPQQELHEAMAKADAVIAHAGIGSALGALSAGQHPILVPRRASRNEHVDDHQQQIARELGSRSLALHREVRDLTWADVEEASRWRTHSAQRTA